MDGTTDIEYLISKMIIYINLKNLNKNVASIWNL